MRFTTEQLLKIGAVGAIEYADYKVLEYIDEKGVVRPADNFNTYVFDCIEKGGKQTYDSSTDNSVIEIKSRSELYRYAPGDENYPQDILVNKEKIYRLYGTSSGEVKKKAVLLAIYPYDGTALLWDIDRLNKERKMRPTTMSTKRTTVAYRDGEGRKERGAYRFLWSEADKIVSFPPEVYFNALAEGNAIMQAQLNVIFESLQNSENDEPDYRDFEREYMENER